MKHQYQSGQSNSPALVNNSLSQLVGKKLKLAFEQAAKQLFTPNRILFDRISCSLDAITNDNCWEILYDFLNNPVGKLHEKGYKFRVLNLLLPEAINEYKWPEKVIAELRKEAKSLALRKICLKVESAIMFNQPEQAKNVLESKFVKEWAMFVKFSLLFRFANNITNSRNLFFSVSYNSFPLKEQTIISAINLLKDFHPELNYIFNKHDQTGDAPLTYTIKHRKSRALLKALLGVNVDVNKPSKNSETPLLYLAILKKRSGYVDILLNKDADCGLSEIKMALSSLIENWDKESLKILKLVFNKRPVVLSKIGEELLQKATLKGELQAVKFLSLRIDLYDDIAKDAIKSGNLDLLTFLMEKDGVKLPKDIPALPEGDEHITFEKYKYIPVKQKMFDFCLGKGLSLSNYSLTSQYVLNCPEAVKCFLQEENMLANIAHKKHSPFRGDSLLHFAAAYAHRESLVLLMIATGLNLNSQDSQGCTPLHYAIKYGNQEAVKILIFVGVKVNIADNEGRTPLHYYFLSPSLPNHIDTETNFSNAKILLEAGADFAVKDNYGQTPLSLSQTDNWNDRNKKDARDFFGIDKPSNTLNVPSLVRLTVATLIANSAICKRNSAYKNQKPEEIRQGYSAETAAAVIVNSALETNKIAL